MPHFYSIAIYRLDDYKKAKLPVLPAIRGVRITKIQILVYVVLFGFATISLGSLTKMSVIYTFIMAALTTYWFVLGVKGFKTSDDNSWGKMMFKFSLNVLLIFSVLISINHLLIKYI
jgi:protoheme IX farnesyltransferase